MKLVSADIVKALQDNISKNQVIKKFLADVRRMAIPLESHMYKPLVRRNYCSCFEYSCIEQFELLNAIIAYNKDDSKYDAKSHEKHAHNQEEYSFKKRNSHQSTS